MGLVNCTYAGSPSAAWGVPGSTVVTLRFMQLRTATARQMPVPHARTQLSEGFHQQPLSDFTTATTC